MSEEDALQYLVDAAAKAIRGEKVAIQELRSVVVNALGRDLSSLRTVRVHRDVLTEFLRRVKAVSSLIAASEAERTAIVTRVRELLSDYIAGAIVGSEDCLVAFSRDRGWLRVTCLPLEQALALAAAGLVDLVRIDLPGQA